MNDDVNDYIDNDDDYWYALRHYALRKQNSTTLYCVTALMNSYMTMMIWMMIYQENKEHDI